MRHLWLSNWRSGEGGQDLVEYAMLIAFIAIIVVVALPPVGTEVRDLYQTIVDGFPPSLP